MTDNCLRCNSPRITLFTSIQCKCNAPSRWHIGQKLATEADINEALADGCTVRMEYPVHAVQMWRIYEGKFQIKPPNLDWMDIGYRPDTWIVDSPWVFTVVSTDGVS